MCAIKKITQIKLLEEVKKRSSKWIKTQDSRYSDFYWQDGYGIFSVSPARVEQVANYIRNQKKHHEKLSFKQEFRRFLKAYQVEYDERYIWD